MTTLDQFKASARVVDLEEAPSWIKELDWPAGSKVRIYQDDFWILQRPDGGHHLLLEADEFSTGPDCDLADLEARLFDYAQND